MKELERRALMGSRIAQTKLAEMGIALPCPFCGSKPKIQSINPSMDEKGRLYSICYVQCTECKTVKDGTPNYFTFNTESGVYETDGKSREIALIKWNCRPAPPIGRCGECANRHSSEFCECRDDQDFCSDFKPKGDGKNGKD